MSPTPSENEEELSPPATAAMVPASRAELAEFQTFLGRIQEHLAQCTEEDHREVMKAILADAARIEQAERDKEIADS